MANDRDEPPEELSDVERDLLDLLDQARIAEGGWELSPDEQRRLDARAREDLARITSKPPAARTRTQPESSDTPSAPKASGPRSRFPRWMGLAAASVLAIAVGTVLVLEPWRSGHEAMASTPPPLEFSDAIDDTLLRGEPADEALAALADVARDQPISDDTSEEPVHAVSVYGWWLATDVSDPASSRSIMAPVQIETYVLPDGVMRMIERRGEPLDDAGHIDREIPVDELETILDEIIVDPYPSPQDIEALPRDPQALVEWVADGEPSCLEVASCLAREIFSWSSNLVLEPELNATAWEALAEFENVEFLGSTTDRIGREVWGLALGTFQENHRLVLLADPSTGALVGLEEVLIGDDPQLGLEAPAVIEFTAIEYARRIPLAAIPD